jgi:hypothetical protein
MLQALPDPHHAGRDLGGVAGKLLAQRQWRRILQVGASYLDDLGEAPGFGVERGVQMREGRKKLRVDLDCRRDMHGGREAVVRRLAQIDVIVRMHRLLGAERAA